MDKKSLILTAGIAIITALFNYLLPVSLSAQVPRGLEIRKIAIVNSPTPGMFAVAHDKTSSSPNNTRLVYMQGSQTTDFQHQIDKPFNIITGRITNDNLDDLIAIGYGDSRHNGGIYLSTNNNGSFGPFQRLPEHLQDQNIWAGALEDIDMDGKADLVGVYNVNTRFKEPSRVLWARNTTPDDADPDGYAFDPWRPLESKAGRFSSKRADNEIAFYDNDQDGRADALRLWSQAMGNATPVPAGRGIDLSTRSGLGFDAPEWIAGMMQADTDQFGYISDIDVSGNDIYLLLRKDLLPDNHSGSDHIYIVKGPLPVPASIRDAMRFPSLLRGSGLAYGR